MKINYDYYNGVDSYSEGDIEDEILRLLDKYGEDNYKEIFKESISWPVFYHISPIRKNIINWYPFKENAEVLEIGAGMGAVTGALCEKAQKVTSVELSKKRASSIISRCDKKYDNLELIIGNFNDIKFDRKYDYITLIGVLEYAPLYTNTQNPFHDFLEKVRGLLKEDGKLLIAIENQYGMKYFSGAPEDHTAKKYDGITGYENKKGIRTYGKQELTEILKNAGYKYTKYYYPMPDYKLPNIIFSDKFYPTEETLKQYTPYVSDINASVDFDEKKAYLDIIKNKQFDFFANSFFIEASMQEIEEDIDLKNQKLVKIDETMQKFYDNQYKIGKKENNIVVDVNQKLIEENYALRTELNAMANSKSWKITKVFRDFRTKHNK